MESRDELKGLRRDLNELLARAQQMQERLVRLESLREPESGGTVKNVKEQASFPEWAEDTSSRGDFVPAHDLETLARAVERGDTKVIMACLQAGLDVNALFEGKSSLDRAVDSGSLDIVSLLVQAGARIEHDVMRGKSHVQRARLLGYENITTFLRRKWAESSGTAVAEQAPGPVPSKSVQSPSQEKSVVEQAVDYMLNLGQEQLKKFHAQASEQGWEMQLGTYLLPRVAVVCISIAVVFFLSLAIERWGAAWMPHVRVAVGYGVSAALLLMAWRSESRYESLARVLYGGGFSVMYFVTFATHYVRFARVFDSPVPALLLLAAIVAAWAVTAQLRQSKVIAVLVTALGHFTVMLSTLTMPGAGVYSLAGILVLSVGSAFFLLRNRWYYVAALGMVGSYGNYFLSLAHGQPGDPYKDFAGSMSILVAFFLVFALAELFAPEDLRRKTVPAWFRNIFVAFNTAACFLFCTMLIEHYGFSRPHQDLFRFAAAILVMSIGIGYKHLRRDDPLFNVYFVKSVALATLALATRYGGNVLSLSLAVEMVVLLFSARRSGLIVMRLLALGVAVITFVQTVTTIVALGQDKILFYKDPASLIPGIPACLVQPFLMALFCVLAFFIVSVIYQRTDWRLCSPRTTPLGDAINELFYNLDLISDPPDSIKDDGRPLAGWLIPYACSIAGAVLFLLSVRFMWISGCRFIISASFSILLTLAAVGLRSKPLGLASVLFFVIAVPLWGMLELIFIGKPVLSVMISGLVLTFLISFSSEIKKMEKWRGLLFHQLPFMPYIFYGISAMLTATLLFRCYPRLDSAFVLTGAAIVAALLFLRLHAQAFGVIACAFQLLAGVYFIQNVMTQFSSDPGLYTVVAFMLVGVSLAGERYFNYFSDRVNFHGVLGAIFSINAFITLFLFIEGSVAPEWRMALSALACFAFLGYGGLFRTPAPPILAVLGAAYVSGRVLLEAFDARILNNGLLLAVVLAGLFWILCERLLIAARPMLERWSTSNQAFSELNLNRPENALAPIGAFVLLMLIALYRIPGLGQWNPALVTIGWFALAAGCFLWSLVVHQRFYRYAGLAVIVLSLVRLFLVDMKEQDPLLRVAAFAVVGVGLLFISIGYFKWKQSGEKK